MYGIAGVTDENVDHSVEKSREDGEKEKMDEETIQHHDTWQRENNKDNEFVRCESEVESRNVFVDKKSERSMNHSHTQSLRSELLDLMRPELKCELSDVDNEYRAMVVDHAQDTKNPFFAK